MIVLTRHAYLPTVTLGWMTYRDQAWATLERPWLPTDDHRGGRPRESCVPDGEYELRNHSGPRFANVWALVNPDLDVHHMPTGTGRSAILIHAGNRVRDVIGCIAIGLIHGQLDGQPAVLSSAQAVSQFRQALRNELPRLRIQPTSGTASGAPWRHPPRIVPNPNI